MPSRVAPQDPLIERLRSATSINALVRFLHDELNWPVDLDAIDDAFYDYEPEELGIKVAHQVAIQSIKQLRPLTSGQPWGIFFVEFDRQKLPMVVLRRVLQGLSLRNREKDKGRQRWHARDLLFISSFGPANDREIALAHFTDETEHGDLPTLRVLGWDGADTNLALAQVATTLREHLRWPADGDTPTGQQRWRERWSSAFRLRYREAVTTARDLALALAYLARAIRTRANEVLAVEGTDGPLTKLFVAFKANLMADLSHDRFADMYAQTITYGLFAARVSRGSGGLVADDAALMIPSTNPFLQELLQDFLAASGRTRAASRRGRGTGIDFDELGVNAVVEQLRAAPMDAVLVSFNNARPGDDPVIHFYEDFLKAYDRAMRVERGVFYTPRPVVQFIVRSVHEVLQTEFGIEDGLASTVTWAQMRQRKPELALPEGTAPESAFVQILDPAVGTATFLVEAVDLIHGHMRSKWQKAGLNKAQQLDAWNTYVRDHLLTRLHGFELMMAPYAIAHMKLGLKLADTGYRFPDGGPRVRVFLSNSLQPPTDVQPQFELMAPMLAHEARAANAVKDHLATTVVIGNPPYSKSSWNRDPWASELIESFKTGLTSTESQIQALSNDYIKFIGLFRLANMRAGIGVLGVITGHGYLHGTQARVLRRRLAERYQRLSFIDLHGSQKRDNAGSMTDESVFDIQTGVAVAICRRSEPVFDSTLGESSVLDVLGTFESKANWLSQHSVLSVSDYATASPPNFFFRPLAENASNQSEYETYVPIPEWFGTGAPAVDKEIAWATGFATQQDDLAIAFTADEMAGKIEDLAHATTKGELAEKYRVCTTNQWNFDAASHYASTAAWREDLCPVAYRPFDQRVSVFSKHVMTIRRSAVMQHLGHPESLALTVSRAVNDSSFAHAFVVREKVDKIFLSSKSSTNAYVFPLWRRAGAALIPNLSERVVAELRPIVWGDAIGSAIELPLANVQDVLAYIYALLHSQTYRARYAQSLKIDFPRIPLPATGRFFEELVLVGKQLQDWHLLEHGKIDGIRVRTQPDGFALPTFFGSDREVSTVAESNRALSNLHADANGPIGTLRINASSGFANVQESVWQHCIGGYQVLHKWLDDRRKARRSLSDSDIAHWRRMYAALQATQELMPQVDAVIERHGGWPSGAGEGGAFSLTSRPLIAEAPVAQAAARPRGRRSAVQPGQQSLLGGDDDPEPAPARPTPAAPGVRTSGENLDDGETMCALRAALAQAADALARDDLIRAAARAMGYARTSARLVDALDDAIRRAVRRGVATNARGALTLASRSIDDYERDALKAQVLAVVRAQRAWVPREDVPRLLARWLGFGRTGGRIVEATESVLRSLVRAGELQAQDGAVRPA